LKDQIIAKDSNGIGLGNVINRLRLYFDKHDVFEIESEGRNKGTKVTIHIPRVIYKIKL
jgi:sensor histidine kinase YesM